MSETRAAIALREIELGDTMIAPGETFECPAADYEDFLAWGAIGEAASEAEKAPAGKTAKPSAVYTSATGASLA